MKRLLTLAICTTVSTTVWSQASFSSSKSKLTNWYQQHPVPTIYCGCDIQWIGKKGKPDLQSCGYQVRKQEKRANRIEHEHVKSAWAMGHQRQCWQNGGRKNCVKTDASFKVMEADPHNLFPSIGEVNSDRSNYRFSQWKGIQGATYGQCELQVDFKARKVMPPQRARGVVARAQLYIADQYGVRLSNSERQLFDAWNKQHPPLLWECERNLYIKSWWGNDNSFVTNACKQ
ncbi:Extracellular deoxyribonuclease precursor [Vibrio thalassae]|uniref:Extracellular deoxyribonuclease n=1 Tax=Vibrio thalassae TaxID=1243014 RepID=A0A240EIH3_9VIBR|nr:endonuclease [Vibrio thalassae]SNX47740.1 Extracellular deoxyribonuclease precursor [Vibrio thalassae]